MYEREDEKIAQYFSLLMYKKEYMWLQFTTNDEFSS